MKPDLEFAAEVARATRSLWAMRIQIDRDVCQSMSYCTHEAPHTLELDSEGLSSVVNPTGDPDEALRRAAKACPVRAIALYDDDGQKIFPPAES